MPRPDKIEAVKEITADLKATDVYYFVDYRGLTFAEATELRARLAKADASLKVVKNTLAKIAAADAGVEGLTELLAGPDGHRLLPRRPRAGGEDHPGLHQREEEGGHPRGQAAAFAAEPPPTWRSWPRCPAASSSSPRWWAPSPRRCRGLVNVLNGPIRGLVVVLAQVQESKANAA